MEIKREEYKRKIIEIIGLRDSRNPIKKKVLCEILRLNERTCRDLVSEISRESILPIGYSSDEPAGYYHIKTVVELEATTNDLISRIAEMQKRVRGIKKAYEEENIGVQIPMERAKEKEKIECNFDKGKTMLKSIREQLIREQLNGN